jgi:hypothetical protein
MELTTITNLQVVVDAVALALCLAAMGAAVKLGMMKKPPDAPSAATAGGPASFRSTVDSACWRQEVETSFGVLDAALQTERDRLMAAHGSRPSTPRPDGNGAAQPPPEKPGRQTSGDPNQSQLSTPDAILNLTRQGHSPMEVARRLSLSLGEVDLVVKLDAHRQQSTPAALSQC